MFLYVSLCDEYKFDLLTQYDNLGALIFSPQFLHNDGLSLFHSNIPFAIVRDVGMKVDKIPLEPVMNYGGW